MVLSSDLQGCITEKKKALRRLFCLQKGIQILTINPLFLYPFGERGVVVMRKFYFLMVMLLLLAPLRMEAGATPDDGVFQEGQATQVETTRGVERELDIMLGLEYISSRENGNLASQPAFWIKFRRIYWMDGRLLGYVVRYSASNAKAYDAAGNPVELTQDPTEIYYGQGFEDDVWQALPPLPHDAYGDADSGKRRTFPMEYIAIYQGTGKFPQVIYHRTVFQ
jgi:hypothetical protein